jgi:hypothetical protein
MLSEKVAANEEIRATQVELGVGDDGPLPFLCECDDVACRTVVRLTSAAYAEARASSGRCVVVEGHSYDGRVISAGEGYVVAEK